MTKHLQSWCQWGSRGRGRAGGAESHQVCSHWGGKRLLPYLELLLIINLTKFESGIQLYTVISSQHKAWWTKYSSTSNPPWTVVEKEIPPPPTPRVWWVHPTFHWDETENMWSSFTPTVDTARFTNVHLLSRHSWGFFIFIFSPSHIRKRQLNCLQVGIPGVRLAPMFLADNWPAVHGRSKHSKQEVYYCLRLAEQRSNNTCSTGPDSPEHHTHEVTLGIILIVYANSALEWPFYEKIKTSVNTV